MKQILPIIVALATATAGAAQTPLPPRFAGGTLKTLNTRGHAATTPRDMAPAPAKRVAEAPADYYEVPFMHTLGKASDQKPNTDKYLVVDANSDGVAWKAGGYTSYSICTGPKEVDANDDWLISPAVHLLAGKEYTVTYDEGVNSPNGTKKSVGALLMGEEQTVEALTTTIVDTHDVLTDFPKDGHSQEVNFTVPADGYYYFGFHCATPKAFTAIYKLRNFAIEETKAKVDPPAAGTLSYTLAPGGELKATVTYLPPTKTVTGADVESISKVEIKTNWVLSHTFTDVTPGEPITFETELYHSPYNRIEATAFTADTPGETAQILDFYAGPDNPLPVEGLSIKLSDDYKHVTLSWNPVSETGESGGYVDTGKVTYYIFDAFGSYYDPALATTDATEYTFDFSDFEGQDFVAYQVTAGIDETYYSLASTSDIVIIGEPDKLPFNESFSNAYYSQMWAIDPASTTRDILCGTVYDNELQTNASDWEAEPEYLNSQDGDNGFFYILPMAKDAVYGFFSTKIDISEAENPVLEFWYQGKGSKLEAMIATDGGSFSTVKELLLKYEPTDRWTLCRIDLAEFKSSRYIQIELKLTAVDNDEETTWSVPIDNIRVRSLVNSDLRLVTLTAPASVLPGTPTAIEAYIENLGTEPCNGATAHLLRNGEPLQELPLETLEPDAFTTAKFSVTHSVLDADSYTYAVEIESEGDAVESNNSAEASIAIEMPVHPAPDHFLAEASDGAVALSWEAPAIDQLTASCVKTEDFENESYTPLTISDFGGWILHDGDKLKTYTFLRDSRNPYSTERMAFQLYNPVVAGVPDDYLIDAQPHSGSTMLVAWSAQGANDNWLISPLLSGNAQTIRFFAKSFSSGFPESFEVLYSTGSTNPEDFVKIDNVENYPDDDEVSEFWTEYSATLPEGALRFAIRHTAYDTYALYLDDITFETAGALPADTEILGYNIYRDGVQLNAEPLAATRSTDRPEESGTYSYRVSTVYNNAESRACAPQSVNVNVNSLNAHSVASGITISGAQGMLSVAGAEGFKVEVSAADGRVVYSATATTTLHISLPAGIYVVSAGKLTAKVAL